ncbi:MAG: HAD-IC family P-type ATPase [Chloroflexota bacterium]
MELLSEVDTVVFDKTGTLTLDEPHVGHIHACADLDEDTVLMFVAAAETRQTHPIARAILTEASQRRLQLPTIQDADYEIGYGLKVQTGDKMVWVGSKRFMTISDIEIPSEISPIESQCDTDGHSLVYAAINGHLVGVIELRPTIRPEAKQIVQSLQARKMHMYIISGDREGPTKKLAQELNIPHYFAETLPENKASLIEELQNQGKAVCFVGDGINDSIALKQANVSVSLQGASTIATDTAQIILMDGSLKQLNALFQLANVANKNMQRNLMTTFIPGLICIGGVFFLHFGILYAIAFYNIGLVTGVINALWPMIVYQKQLSSQQHAYLGSKIGESHDPNIMPLPE